MNACERGNNAHMPHNTDRVNGNLVYSLLSHEFENLVMPRQPEKRATQIPSSVLPPSSLIGRLINIDIDQSATAHVAAQPDWAGSIDLFSQPLYEPVGALKYEGFRFSPLKPTAPERYNGEADPIKFSRYAQQCYRYVQEVGFPSTLQVQHCGDFVDGKALAFYQSNIVPSDKQWTLPEYLRELFLYCFPADFRLRQREKLNKFEQGNLIIKQYASEMSLLFKIVGTSTPQERIDKLFYRMRNWLRHKLMEQRIDPLKNTWDEVMDAATVFETAAMEKLVIPRASTFNLVR